MDYLYSQTDTRIVAIKQNRFTSFKSDNVCLMYIDKTRSDNPPDEI